VTVKSVRLWVLVAALDGFLAVLAGAGSAHLFASDPRGAILFKTAAEYGMYHGLALLALAGLAGQVEGFAGGLIAAAGWLFVTGIALFSGSLYLLALTGVHGFGFVTPFGGVALLLGWLALLVAAFSAVRKTGWGTDRRR
jgi:uncharacterized membrane protein YgdD (TMEM256/DUF423 family)